MKNHELFPPDDDKPAPDVQKICVSRVENGHPVLWPYGYVAAEELPDLQTLHAKCGGGRYELVARDDKRIVARRTYTLAGESKPLDGSKPAPAAMMAMPQAAPSGGPGLMQMLPMLAPLVLGWLDLSAKRDAAQMQMFSAMLNAKSSDANSHVQAMQSMYQANTQQMAQLFAQVAAGMKGGSGEDNFLKAFEMAHEFLQGQRDSSGDGDDGEDVVDKVGKTLEVLDKAKRFIDAERASGQPATESAQRPPASRRAAAPTPAPPEAESSVLPDDEDDDGDDK